MSPDPSRPRKSPTPQASVPDAPISEAPAPVPHAPTRPIEAAGDPPRPVQEIEWELARVRSEASAARWEARAAELELLLQRSRGPAASDRPVAADRSSDHQRRPSPAGDAGACYQRGELHDWEPLVRAVQRRADGQSKASAAVPSPAAAPSTAPARRQRWRSARGRGTPPRAAAEQAGHAPHAARLSASDGAPPGPADRPDAKPPNAKQAAAPWIATAGNARVVRPHPGRRRPAAWLFSVAAHAAVLLMLALMSLHAHQPKDQITLSASATASDSTPLETMEFTAVEPTVAPVPASSEAIVAVSPLSDVAAVSELAAELDPVTAPSGALAEALSSMATAGDLALPTRSELTTQFFGLEGGGNHFCYVVDCSLSMSGGRFEGARAELLRSIDQLTAEQRFYVIFYSAQLQRMQIGTAGRPDDYSVMATPENKRAVRRWAMGVRLQRGGPPDDALRFALQLRPDVIFLLSDGEFPQRIEGLVSQLNRSDNLFGDDGPRSILHTIGYQSRDGESRMHRLAKANGGQYRYVPER